jgi:hypothetical protein
LARSAKQVAAQRKAALASARKRRKVSALSEIKRYNQHGPLADVRGKRLAEGIGTKYPVLSRAQSGIGAKPKAKRRKHKQTDHDRWKSSWGMGAG